MHEKLFSMQRVKDLICLVIFLQVKYPDTNTDLIIPTANDLKRQSLLHHRLTTNVILSHGHWSGM